MPASLIAAAVSACSRSASGERPPAAGSSGSSSVQALTDDLAGRTGLRGTLPHDECTDRRGPQRVPDLRSGDPFGARTTLGDGLPDYVRLDVLADRVDLARAPVTLRILLEDVLRHAGGGIVRPEDGETLAASRPGHA